MDKVLEFLQDLTKNNNREWFNNNKDRYNVCKEKILFLTDVLINEIGEFDSQVKGVAPKDCVFRIFRDVRFSKDKVPYKTNFGSFIARGGRKSMNPGYYFHIEPDQSFIGGGLYMPPAEPLRSVRNYMAENAPEFKSIINDSAFKTVFPEMYDHQLKTAPKGFAKDHEHIEFLRYKSIAFSWPIANNIVTGKDFIENTVNAFRQLQKVNEFLYRALA